MTTHHRVKAARSVRKQLCTIQATLLLFHSTEFQADFLKISAFASHSKPESFAPPSSLNLRLHSSRPARSCHWTHLSYTRITYMKGWGPHLLAMSDTGVVLVSKGFAP